MASTEVSQAIKEADEILSTATANGIGSTLRYLRICKALAPLREIESHCSKHEDLGPIRRRLLVIQVSSAQIQIFLWLRSLSVSVRREPLPGRAG
jgi:hypothetical protein